MFYGEKNPDFDSKPNQYLRQKMYIWNSVQKKRGNKEWTFLALAPVAIIVASEPLLSIHWTTN